MVIARITLLYFVEDGFHLCFAAVSLACPLLPDYTEIIVRVRGKSVTNSCRVPGHSWVKSFRQIVDLPKNAVAGQLKLLCESEMNL